MLTDFSTAKEIKSKINAPYVHCGHSDQMCADGFYMVMVSLDSESDWDKTSARYINSRFGSFCISENGKMYVECILKYHTLKEFKTKIINTIDDAIAEIQKWIDSHTVAA